MSETRTNPMKRFLLWLSGAPAEPSQATTPNNDTANQTAPPPPAETQAPVAEAAEPVAAASSDSATADSSQPVAPSEPATTAAPAVAAAAAAAVVSVADKNTPGAGMLEAAAVVAETPNDATGYGVMVVPADVPAGSPYWRAVLVHHLTPDENHTNHHLFLDALDEKGDRIAGARGRITWEGGEQIVTVDKPAGEPGTNFPMWKWQVCAVEMLDLPSDRVTGLHTGHPDEPPGIGNTLFHHSFAVHFQRAIKGALTDIGPQQGSGSVISGTVSNAAGHALLLTMDGEIVAKQMLDPAGAYRFDGLAAGDYVLSVEGSGTHSGIVAVDGKTATTVVLAVPAALAAADAGEKFIDRYFLFGAPSSSRTAVYLDLARSYLLSHQPTFGFRAEDARHAQRVVLMGAVEDIPQATEDALRQAGCQVQRISGTPQQIQDGLRQLDTGGHQIFLPMTPLDTRGPIEG